ncbi:DNA ligase 4-like, partial [Pollicipes pollicipes]|uniref:DNA ligase 4-like n=1 Tax=Pollicipes pollicipes TaxID=41117 RepID=UPI0018858DD0
SAHTLLRLVLPQLDRLRGPYGAKERRLADLADADRLRRLGSDGGTQQGGGDFAQTVFHVLRDRCRADSSGWSMQDVDSRLTQLAERHQSSDVAGVKAVMDELVRSLSAREQLWLVRIILGEMQLGVGSTALLNAFHPDAAEHYGVTCSLLRVAADLAEPAERRAGPAGRRPRTGVTLFTPFKPMLSERSGLGSVDKQMRHKPFFVEPKHDGERVQLHKDGEKYMFFSRGGFDFTASYGASPAAGSLVPHIHPQFNASVRSCILDGEMLVWNDIERRVIVKAEAPDVKKLRPGGRLRPLFVPFDLVYFNGEQLTDRPLSERLSKLKSVFRPLEGRLDVNTRIEASTAEEVVKALNEAIDRQEEGLILKDPTSMYWPNERRKGWAKVKPDYVNSLVDDLDMVIIGGYWGKGARRGTVCQFLLGAAEPPERDGEHPQVFLSAGCVSSGITDQQLHQLLQQLMPHMQRTRRDGRPPPSLRWTREKPDLYIEPSLSRVLQVKATELVESSSHAAGLVPRFARVVSARTDKAWHECVTTTELRQLRERAGGKLAAGHLQSVPERAPAARRTVAPSLPAHLRPADLRDVRPASTRLAGRQLCVMTCDGPGAKQELERLIHGLGGSLTQNPTSDTWCVIADRVAVKERSVIASGRCDVVRSAWVRRAGSGRRLPPFAPAEILHQTPATALTTQLHYDQHGDSYAEDVDGDQLRALLQGMPSEPRPLPSPPPELTALFEHAPFSLLAGCRCFLAPPLHGATVAGLLLRLHGARLALQLDNDVSHVVTAGDTDELRTQNRLRSRKFHLVSERWVEESIAQGRWADERAFPPGSCLVVPRP